MIFAKYQFKAPEKVEKEVYKPCELGLCDGSGLVETKGQWVPGMRFLKCPCKK